MYSDDLFWLRLSLEETKLYWKYPFKPWNWRYMTKFVDLEFIEMFPDYDWNWNWLAENANINFVMMFSDKNRFNFNTLLNTNMTIKEFNHFDFNVIDFIENGNIKNDIEEMMENYPCEMHDFYYRNPRCTIDDIVKYKLRGKQSILRKLEFEASIKEKKTNIDPRYYKKIPIEYIINNPDIKWDWKRLSQCTNITKHINDYVLPLNYKNVVYSLNNTYPEFIHTNYKYKYVYHKYFSIYEIKLFMRKSFDYWFFHRLSELLRVPISDEAVKLIKKYWYKPWDSYYISELLPLEFIEQFIGKFYNGGDKKFRNMIINFTH